MVDLIESILCDGCGYCVFKGEDKKECLGNIDGEVRQFNIENGINKWLNSFNTDSATVCFTAIQELKKAVSENEKTAN